jgi:uroporphyrinogen decarboxylase
MKKKNRVVAAIQKQPVDGIPSGFSLHFPSEQAFGDAGVQAHLAFFKETDTDICKIMNEHLVPSYGKFDSGKDYRRIPTFAKDTPFIAGQIRFTGKILEKADPNAFMMGTLHGILASAIHPLEKSGMPYEQTRTFLAEALREDPQPVLDAFARIADGMCALAMQYRSAGMDGIYYAALGAEKRYFTDEEFAKWIAPYDRQILQAIKESGAYSFLHMCKDGLDLRRYAGYMDLVDVVNWGVYEAPLSLEEGRSLFSGKTVMGGLPNRTGVLVDGTEEEIRESVRSLIEEMGHTGFILGADCTLATEQDIGRVRTAVAACRG